MAKIIRKDKMLAGYNGNLESVIVHDTAGSPVETSNGVFVKVEGLMEGQREVKKATLATEEDVLAGENIYLIHNSEVMYDERLANLEDFVIKAGKVARAYRLYDGDVITLTVPLFTAEPSVDSVVIPKTDGLLGAPTAETTGAKLVFEVIEDSGNELHHTEKAYAVEVKQK